MENEASVGPQNRILDGDLETLGLQSTLKMLALGGKTGVLIVQTSNSRLNIFIQDGAITRLEDPSTPDPDLFDLFRAMGRISTDQAMLMPQDARRDLAATTQYMVNNGMLSPAEELQRREFMVTQALSRAIRWDKGRFEFRRDISMMRRTGGMYTPSAGQPMNVDHVLLEALRLADERDHMAVRPLPRFARTRKVPLMADDSRLTRLSANASWVYKLCDERRPVYAIAFALLMPEAETGALMANLLAQGLLDLVDHRAEEELSQSLIQTLMKSRGALEKLPREAPEQLMLSLSLMLGGFINDLLAHHAHFARSGRTRGDTGSADHTRRIDELMTPLVERAARAFPRMEGLVTAERGQIAFGDLKTLNKVVRGQELTVCYWDSARMMRGMAREVYDAVCADELGQSRGARPFDDVWKTLLRDIDYDMGRLHQWYTYQLGAQQARG
ncbi:MAG TPA: DUF4388 domain-containing protein [Ktedonobacterales bacterium]